MFNLTHNEDSGVDVGGVWTGPDEFELSFRFNADDQEDLNIHLILTREEVDILQDWLQRQLAHNKVQ
jgi:hypothetical protein